MVKSPQKKLSVPFLLSLTERLEEVRQFLPSTVIADSPALYRFVKRGEIFPESRTGFFSLDADTEIVFMEDKPGFIKEQVLKQLGRKIKAKRIE